MFWFVDLLDWLSDSGAMSNSLASVSPSDGDGVLSALCCAPPWPHRAVLDRRVSPRKSVESFLGASCELDVVVLRKPSGNGVVRPESILVDLLKLDVKDEFVDGEVLIGKQK